MHAFFLSFFISCFSNFHVKHIMRFQNDSFICENFSQPCYNMSSSSGIRGQVSGLDLKHNIVDCGALQ